MADIDYLRLLFMKLANARKMVKIALRTNDANQFAPAAFRMTSSRPSVLLLLLLLLLHARPTAGACSNYIRLTDRPADQSCPSILVYVVS